LVVNVGGLDPRLVGRIVMPETWLTVVLYVILVVVLVVELNVVLVNVAKVPVLYMKTFSVWVRDCRTKVPPVPLVQVVFREPC
jgi:hypothetical protein